jgi:hypothetical protein
MQIMKLQITEFSTVSCDFLPLRSKYSPQHPVLKRLSPRDSFKMKIHVSLPYKTKGKITVLCTLYVCT